MIIREVLLTEVWQLRQEVMYPQAPIAEVQLLDDQKGMHLGLYEDGQLVTVISLFVSGQALQFRKFATRNRFLRRGYGTAMLQYVIDWAKANGSTTIWCNARLTATGLYKQFGMKPIGKVWKKNEIEYIKMQKEL
jgi:phosphoribosylformimino-5-aminoimidazole carboxamide ribotide isomerase